MGAPRPNDNGGARRSFLRIGSSGELLAKLGFAVPAAGFEVDVPMIIVEGVRARTKRRVEIAAGGGAGGVVECALGGVSHLSDLINAAAAKCDAGDVDRQAGRMLAQPGAGNVVAHSAFEPWTCRDRCNGGAE